MGTATARVFSRGREQLGAAPGGGLIAIGGPPLAGKSVLAARLVECLPEGIKLETTDNLEFDREYLRRSKAASGATANPQRELLAQARQLLDRSPAWSVPIVVVSCRFATPVSRRSAQATARAAGVRFLFVEARSRDIRALRRIPMSFLSPEDLKLRTARYERALHEYRPLTRDEVRLLPGLCLTKVLSDFDPAVARVLTTWHSPADA